MKKFVSVCYNISKGLRIMARTYKLIIVDNEYLVRKGIEKTVDWASLGIEVVAECDNGKQALEAVKKYAPDLIISDVRMPVMDGLELAERLAEADFDGAIIFYSGYNDFEYVRKALEYGVSGYLLKPEGNEQLTKKVLDTLAALEERRKKRNALESLASGAENIKEMYFSRLEDGVDDANLRGQLSVLNIEFPSSGIVVCGRSLRVNDGAFGEFYGKFAEALENFGSIGRMGGGKFILVTALTDVEALRECAGRLLDECYAGTVYAAVGISEPFGIGLTMCEAAARARRAATPVLEVGGVYSGVEQSSGGREKPKALVEAALALIYEHYAEKVTVKWAAEKLFVSESHLMHEFKVETGKTFNDCLKYYRIAKAKELLKQGTMRVNEIASAVGFSDGRYFGQVFREQVGVTPSEYAESVHEEE